MIALKHITAHQIGRIAELARQAAEAHGAMLNKLGSTRFEEPVARGGDHQPSPVDSLSWLEDTASGAPVQELRESIEDLSDDQRQELRAVMLVGRGDFCAPEWPAALERSRAMIETAAPDDMADKVALHAYLAKGLYALGLMPET